MEIALLWPLSVAFWRLWKKVCSSQQPLRDLPLLFLIPLLSPMLVGFTWWHTPEKGSNFNIWFIVIPLFMTVAMFSYCLYSRHTGRYPLLSGLGVFMSAVAAFIECCYAIVVMVITIVELGN